NIHAIRQPGIDPFLVPCNSSVSGAGSGWIVIQRRVDGSVSFNRSWEEYKHGFGDLRGNFFLGLEKIHRLTSNQPHELYLELRDVRGTTQYARYNNFRVGSEEQAYELIDLGEYSGTAGNSFVYHQGNKFSTFDRDNDTYDGHCARRYGAGWWYFECLKCLLNGKYMEIGLSDLLEGGIEWGYWSTGSWLDYSVSLVFTQMMIRPKEL
ncbi:hypothetical protein KR018_006212, partial [Drosophila ironensis]